MQYTELRLPSGVTVNIAPRMWAHYEAFEDWRLAEMEKLAGMSGLALETARHRLAHEARMRLLGMWVQDFELVKSGLNVKDIAAIEDAALALEKTEVPLGNSRAGGDGPSTANA